jgi:hypothetical protein
MPEDEREDLWPYLDDVEKIVTYELDPLDPPAISRDYQQQYNTTDI